MIFAICSEAILKVEFHGVAKPTGRATTRSRLLFLGKRGCESWLPFPFKWQPNIATQKSTSSPRRWREHFPTPPSPPRFAVPNCAADLFPRGDGRASHHRGVIACP